MSNFSNGSGRGRLATDRYDFENHVTGVNRNHSDDQISISDPITGLTGNNVHEVLVSIGASLLNSDLFVSVGEGADVYESGVFDDSVPDLDVELNDVLYNVNNLKNARITNGGIIFIRSGTYKIGETVDIPAGITLVGEGFGTKLINTTALNAGQAPMFRIKSDIDRYEDKAVISSDPTYDPFSNSKTTKILNCVISDNYVKPAYLGDTTYRAANNTSYPLVYVEHGSSLFCNNVSFFGRSSSGTPSLTTLSAIETDPMSGSSYPTNLTVNNCEFDGFNRLIKYVPEKGTLDNFKFTENRARAFGPVGGSATLIASNVLFLNACNTIISNNYFTALLNPIAYVYIDDFTGDTATVQNRSKIAITNNVFASDKASNSDVTPVVLEFKASLSGTKDDFTIPFLMGNIFDETNGTSITVGTGAAQFTVTSAEVSVISPEFNVTSPEVNVTSSGLMILDTGRTESRSVVLDSTVAVGGNYTVDSGAESDYILQIPGGANFVTIGQVALTMPAVTLGRIVILKEIQNDSGGSNTITCAGTDLIEDPKGTGYSASISFPPGGCTITYIGTNNPTTELNQWSILSFWNQELGAAIP